MAYYNDPYSQDPYASGYQDAWQDPNQGWWQGNEEYQEETESQKLRKEQEMIEAIESNRLYLRKVRRKCVQEDFANLEKTQMFLFEFLIETLEVNTKSELGLVPETEETSELVARVQFIDNPYLEIREKGEKIEESDSVIGQTEYFSTVGNAGLQDALDPGKAARVSESSTTGSNEEPPNEVSNGDKESIVQYDTKWENSSGKSLLFSKSALEIIQGLDKTPVKVQVSMCVESTEEEGKRTCEPLGYTLVRLPDHFNLSVLQSCKSGVILPVSCVHRDTCKLKNVFGVVKGELQVFVRLSCFGSVITTSFQSVGPERRYVFKPSPLPSSSLEVEEENEDKRDLALKPIVAEEEVAIGITILKDKDLFQKSVLWKNNPQNCGCLEMASDKVQFTESSLRMPRPSDVSLCRDAKTCKQVGKPFCQWHDLVTKEIKNNPGGNCGCLDGVKIIVSPPQAQGQLGLPNSKKPSPLSESSLVSKEFSDKPSRIEKMLLRPKKQQMLQKVPEKEIEPIKGLGLQPEPTDCNCDCPQIRNSLAINPMMKYTWEIK